MAKMPRKRRVKSVADELLTKSREAALAAVQVFNSPTITFKSEMFIVLMTISWTYLLHAYYRKHGIEYRYFSMAGKRRRFDKTKNGQHKHWELERCLNDRSSPIDRIAAQNLRFLIEIRHEIEHRMTTRIDGAISAKFQACCLNYNLYVKKLFGDRFGIDKHLSFSLQFSSITPDQLDSLKEAPKLPKEIQATIDSFEAGLTRDEFNSPHYAYRILFTAKTANRKGQADQVIEFIKADSPLANTLNAEYAVIKETERPKMRPSEIVNRVKKAGYKHFSITDHTRLWQDEDAKNTDKGFGTQIAETWYWYESWLAFVIDYCKRNRSIYE